MNIKRRWFFKQTLILTSVSVLFYIPFSCAKQEKVIDEEKMNDLWDIFLFISLYWKNKDYVGISFARFSNFIEKKIEFDTSYQYIYLKLLKIYDQKKMENSKEKALHHLYFQNQDDQISEKVISEFIKLNLIHGGFKVWGLKNYFGYRGGSFSTNPYR